MIKQTLAMLAAAGLVVAFAGNASATTITFDDLALAPDSYYFPEASSAFTSGGATFDYSYTDWGGGYYSWSGFAYSNKTDIETAGIANQYSVYATSGAGGSANYGLSYVDSFSVLPAITFAAPAVVESANFANTTYTALAILNGDTFSKQFGGVSGNDADWLKLIITGYDASGASTGAVDFYLADYRFSDNSLDYIVSDWTNVNLSSLGEVSALKFDIASSDVGAYGINTPMYFAVDNIVVAVPEPTEAFMLLAGLGFLGFAARRRQQG